MAHANAYTHRSILVFLFQVNILLLDKFSHFCFITDYMTVPETVHIVAK